MTHKATIPPLMVQLKHLDREQLTPRDILILWCILKNPGVAGVEVVAKLGLPSRSAIQNNLPRLVLHGMIEDRRAVAKQTVPNILHVTPKGVEFFNGLLAEAA